MSDALDITALGANPLDGAPVDRMAFAFSPPEHIRNHPDLNALFEEIVLRMRREAEGIAMETNQLLLLAQIAQDFCEMKYRDEVGWIGTNARKDAKAQWVGLMAEWRAVLKDNKDKLSDKVVDDFMEVIRGSLELIPDDENETRRKVQLFQKNELARRGY